MSGIVDIYYDDGKYHDRIEVAGEFTHWQGVPLGLDSGTTYAAVFDGAEPGKCYQYKFIVDGHWTLHPNLPTIEDAAGFVNHPAVAESANRYEQKSVSNQSPSGDGAGGANVAALTTGATSVDPGNVPGTQSASAQEKAIEQEELRDSLGSTPGTAFGTTYGTPTGLPSATYSQGQSLPGSTGVHSGLKSLNTAYGSTELNAQTSAAPEPYELKNSQLDKPYERVDGLDQFVGQKQPAVSEPEPYELKGSQLEKPVEKVSGLDQVNTGAATGAITGNATTSGRDLGTSEPYEVIGSDLDKPTEKVSGLEHFVTGVPLNLSNQSYELKGSDLSKPVEKVEGLDEINRETAPSNFQESFVAVNHKEPTSSGYELKAQDLAKPKESIGGESEPFAYNGIPGSLPFEQRVAGHVSPEQVTDSTVSALGGESKEDSLTSRGVGVDSLDNSFDGKYESANEDGFDEPPAATAVLGKPLDTTAVPLSASDRTISKKLADEDGSSSLDRAAAERAVRDTESVPEPLQPTHFKTSDGTEGVVIPSNVDEDEVDLPSRGTSSTSSPKKHVPIDVSTGFPVDDPEQQQPSQRSSNSSARNQPRSIGGIPTTGDRRPLSYSGLPATGVSAPVNTHENRNAAVIAAAAKASAFAKQDVAAISNPQQYQQQQSSPRPTREKSRRPLSTSFGHGKKLSSTSASSSPTVPRPEVSSSLGSSGLPRTGGAAIGAEAGTSGSAGLAGAGAASTGHYNSATAPGLSKGALSSRGNELGGATSSFERERQGIPQLERTSSKRGSKVKSFFRKLASK